MLQFDFATATAADFDVSLAQLRDQLADLEARAERTKRRIEWLSEGRLLYDSDDHSEVISRHVRATLARQTENVVDLPASREPARKPNLRQAIQLLLAGREREHGDEPEWRAKDVIAGLRLQCWMPNGLNAESMVRNMLRNMASRDELERPNYGTYRLAPSVRARIDARRSVA